MSKQHEERIVAVGKPVALFPRISATLELIDWPVVKKVPTVGGYKQIPTGWTKTCLTVKVTRPKSTGMTFLWNRNELPTVWQLRNAVVREFDR